MSYRFDGFARVRCELELSDKVLTNINDVNGDPARFPRGAKTRFEFALFFSSQNSTGLVDASQIDSPRLRIFASDDPDGSVAIDSITTGATVRLKGDLTATQWASGDPAMAHLVFEFPASQTAEGVFGGTLDDGDEEHWFLITNGSGGDFIACGKIRSFDAGYNPAGGTPPAAGNSATIEAIDALLNARLASFVKYRGNPPGATIELTAPSSGKTGKIGLDDDGNLITPNQVST